MTPRKEIAEDLKNLLSKWKLECLLPHLLAEKIDVDVLQMMKPCHIRLLLYNFPLGIQIRFEYNLELWRKDIGRPFQIPITNEDRFSILTTEPNIKDEMLKPNVQNKEIQTDFKIFHVNSIRQINNKNSNKDMEDAGCSGSISLIDDPMNDINLSPVDQLSSDLPNTFKFPRTSPEVDLRTILLHSACGLGIIKNYRIRKRFSNSERKLLISTIVNYFLEYNLEFNIQISYALERDILKMFRSEMLSFYRTTRHGRIYTSYIKAKAASKSDSASYVNESNINVNNEAEAVDETNNELFEMPIASQLKKDDQNTESFIKSDVLHFEKEYNDSVVSDNNISLEDFIKVEPENLSETSSLDSSPILYTIKQLRTEDSLQLFKNFIIPWHKLPNKITNMLKNKVELGKCLNVIANLIVDELRIISTHIPARVLRSVTQQAVIKYPHSFLLRDAKGNLQPTLTTAVPLLSRMRNRNCNLNRILQKNKL